MPTFAGRADSLRHRALPSQAGNVPWQLFAEFEQQHQLVAVPAGQASNQCGEISVRS
jgi:hypothetical protein